MKKYSMKEIAKLSGVSVATVSRVINNNGRFSEETRRKVEKVIEETGYQPNFSAKSLRMNKTFSIGILVPDITNAFFAKVVQKIEEILFMKGYSTIICNTARDNEKEEAYLNILESKGVDGIIVISGAEKFDFKHFSNTKKVIPYICIDREPKHKSDTIFISSDHYQGAFEATEHLINSGCQFPAIAIHDRKYSFAIERLNGFKDALSKNNYTYNEETHQLLIDRSDSDFDFKVKNFLESNPQVDGFFGLNDGIAMRLLMELKKVNINVPQDIKIIGFDDIPQNKYSSPTLSSVKHNTSQISELAVENLLKLIEYPENTGDTIITPVSLSLRESTQ